MIVCDACRKTAGYDRLIPLEAVEVVQVGPGREERQPMKFELCLDCYRLATNQIATKLRDFIRNKRGL